MTNNDYIRAAVGLATGWEVDGPCIEVADEGEMASWRLDTLPQYALDALAAQLVRQVDALPVYLTITPQRIEMRDTQKIGLPIIHQRASVNVIDRTMNTIKAIVASGVLGNDAA